VNGKTEAAKNPEDLPIFSHKAAILKHIQEHRVTHIQGETGCGKSTQVPKYIIEDELSRKPDSSRNPTKIVVTQPRRMAAITLARRVASEMGEEIGKTVGYKISGDSISGAKLSFATTGYLLQVLVNQPEEFKSYSHVILDEVHERSVDADLLTMLLKLLMQCFPHVKLIVMSATLQAKLFAEYFSQVEEAVTGRRGRRDPSLDARPIFVGVRTFPVEDIFLDELHSHFTIDSYQAKNAVDKALRGFASINKGKSKGKEKASGFKRLEPQITDGFDELCRELVCQMAREMCTLIVFLPGIADITSFYETLSPLDSSRKDRNSLAGWRDTPDGSPVLANGAIALRIYPMHSLIPRDEQEEVFNSPPAGVCHVVLASNIAESSLTLPSVCGIIDLALRRSIQYDARRLMSCLVTTWCSQSSCKQRAGRAGRTMAGRAVRLVTRPFFQRNMVEFDPPEMLNAPLTKLYLQAKQLCGKLQKMWDDGLIPEWLPMNLQTPQALLQEVVQPPDTELVDAAIEELADTCCIDQKTNSAHITPLGQIAMALPCELRLCRLLYYGLMLNCPNDAIAIVASLTAADPFSTPSLIVLKDEKDYVRKLERSFAARLWCDDGKHSEPLMLRELFMQWVQAGAPRGPGKMGSFARDWSVIPKKFEALVSDAIDLCSRLLKLLAPRSQGHKQISGLMASMRCTVDRREELVKAVYPSNEDYKGLFVDDKRLLRALLAAAFSDQMLLYLNPRWAPNPNGGKKRKEEEILDIMQKQELAFDSTVCYLNPPSELRQGDAEENYQRLCEAMCGDRADRIHFDDRNKLLFYEFHRPRRRGRGGHLNYNTSDWQADGDIIQDVIPQVHRLHQFGAGRWKFNVENPMGRQNFMDNFAPDQEMSPTLELLKPLQPFLINWEVLQFEAAKPGGGGKKGSAKKPSAVKAMPDWRNPLGFACNANYVSPAQELLGVCASVQGLESGGSAFVAGVTVLGLSHLPLLLTTLDPVKWQVKFLFDPDTHDVLAIKILHHEIQLPAGTLTPSVIWKINQVRESAQQSLTPWEEEDDWSGSRRQNRHIWIGDLSEEMYALLDEVWDEWDDEGIKESARRRRKGKLFESQAAAENWEDDEDGSALSSLDPFTEEPIYYTGKLPASSSQGQKGKKNGKTAKGGKGSDSLGFTGVDRSQAQALKGLVDWLGKQPQHQAKLSEVGGRFKVNKKLIAKFPNVLQCRDTPVDDEAVVRLVAGDGKAKGKGALLPSPVAANGKSKGKTASSKGKGSRDDASKGSGKAGASRLDARIEELCQELTTVGDVGCRREDFDGGVRRWLRDFEKNQGSRRVDEAFEMLSEWCSKKPRSSVASWPKYLTTLLRKWEEQGAGS